jgi:hypothetical protein
MATVSSWATPSSSADALEASTAPATLAAPEIVRLTSTECATVLFSSNGFSMTGGIKSLVTLPNGLAIAGAMYCDGVLKQLALWDGSNLTFPAWDNTKVIYALAFFKGDLWVGEYGRYALIPGMTPRLGTFTSMNLGGAMVLDYLDDEHHLLAHVVPKSQTRRFVGGDFSGGSKVRIFGPDELEINCPMSLLGECGIGALSLLLTPNGPGWIAGDPAAFEMKSVWFVPPTFSDWQNSFGVAGVNLSNVSSYYLGNVGWHNGAYCSSKVGVLISDPELVCPNPLGYSDGDRWGFRGGNRYSNMAFSWQGYFWTVDWELNSGYDARSIRVRRDMAKQAIAGFVKAHAELTDVLFFGGKIDSAVVPRTSDGYNDDGYDPYYPANFRVNLARITTASAALTWTPGAITGVTDNLTTASVACSPGDWRGGAAASSFEFEVIVGGGAPQNSSSPITSCGVTFPYDHATHESVSVRYRIVSPDGAGPWSEAWTGQPSRIPDAVTDLELTEADRTLTASWGVPNVPAAPAITHYEWSRQAFTPGTVNRIEAGDITALASGLTNGTTYTIGVRACNALGCGAISAQTATPAAVPTPPRNLAIAARDEGIDLVWQAPLATNGASLVSYEISINDGEWVAVGSAATTWSTSAINGAAVIARIRAINRMGPSAVITSSSVVPDWTPPSAPRSFAATPSDGSVTLNWASPSASGSRSRLGYRVYWRTGADAYNSQDLSPTATTVTIPGLSNGVNFAFVIAAYTSAGEGVVAQTNATPAALPSAPSSVALIGASNSQLQLSWGAPVSDGGSAITGYRIRIWALGNVIRTTLLAPTSTSAVLTGLPNEVDIRADVHAVTSAGESERASVAGRMRDTAVSAASIGVSGVLYPVRDGYGDVISLGVTLSERADVTLTIQSSTGTTWLTKSYSYAKGNLVTTWNGRSGSKTAGAGTYSAKWKITDAYGNTRTISQPITVSSKQIVSSSSSRSYAPQKGAGFCYEWAADAGPGAGYWRCAATAKGAYRLDVDAGRDQLWQYTIAAPISGFREITGVEIRVCGTVSAGDAGDIYLWSDNDNDYRTWDRISGDTTTCRDVQLSDPSAVASDPAIWLYVQAQGGGDPLLWTVTSITVTVTGTVLK